MRKARRLTPKQTRSDRTHATGSAQSPHQRAGTFAHARDLVGAGGLASFGGRTSGYAGGSATTWCRLPAAVSALLNLPGHEALR